ncbi:MAG: magnesium-translocating P-type ATPase [Dongiaceae bacterium]
MRLLSPSRPAGRRAPAEAEFWNRPLAALQDEFGHDPGGLAAAEVERRRARFGANEAADRVRPALWLQFLSRFQSPLILILLIASLASAAAGDLRSFAIVAVIVLLSVVLDFVQEVRAENAVEALRRSVAVRVAVRRGGQTLALPAAELVPGDLVELAAGDLVPADGRVIEGRDFFVNQALLSGEPYPVEKRPLDLEAPAESAAAAGNAAFMGTSVISGMALLLVCRTGRDTALGQLAGALRAKPPPAAFELGLRRYGGLILRLTLFLVLLVLLVNLLFHRPWLEALMFSVALAVGLTPELLPMVVTVTLARGAIRMASRRVIVKRLSAMHNLGAMDVLATDKTGTLTQARIDLARSLDPDGNESAAVFEAAYLNSHFESGFKSPLDAAILAHRTLDVAAWRKLDEVPFDFERRRVSVLVARGEEHLLAVKGAPEDVLAVSTFRSVADGGAAPLDAAGRRALMAMVDRLGADGFRLLGVATRALTAEHLAGGAREEAALVFAGFLAFMDPAKPDAATAVTRLAADGVAVRILTGDTEPVTRHLCGELGIDVEGVVTGPELVGMSDEALLGRLRSANLFCRVTPQQKHRIILALKRAGGVVGFLGDGINDAPALHAADVGISVEGAADVAKEAADLILLEHDLSVLHGAVMEGRRAVVNVAKYILMGGSSNFGNMFSMAGAALLLPFLPMLPIQVLLNNLLYDTSELALPFDRVDEEAMARPVRWDMRLIERFMLVFGPLSSVFDFLTFGALLWLLRAGEAEFQTGWFVESLASQILVIFVIRTRRSLFASRPHPLLTWLSLGLVAVAAALPFAVGRWFGFVPLPPVYYLFLAAAILAYLALVEGAKRYFLPAPGGRS